MQENTLPRHSHRLAHSSNAAAQHYHLPCMSPSKQPSKPGIPPDQRWRVSMKKMFLTAFTILGLAATAVAPVAANAAAFHNGSTVAGDASATRQQQTGSYDE